MSILINVSGVAIERLKGSVNIYDAIEQRSTASFVAVDRLGVETYQKGQPIEIISNIPIPPFAHPEFTGFIENVKRHKIAPNDTTIYWTIQCIDNHYLADKRIAAEIYTSKTAKYIVEDLITNYLAAEGVTVGEVQTGPTFEGVVINYQPISKVLDSLAEKSNFIWYIDEDKKLYFIERTTYPAPFSIDSGDILKDVDMSTELEENNPSYRNAQYFRGGKATTALQTFNATGDGVTVAFALGYPLASVPTVTVGGAAQTVGLKGVDSGMDCYWSQGDSILVFDNASIPGVAAIVVTYYGEYPLFVYTDDTVAINALKAVEGGTGIIETLEDDASATTRNDALAISIAQLEKFGVVGKRFPFPINNWGLKPGQMVTVDYPAYGLNNADLLVESVEVSELAPNELRYLITAIEGPELGDWTGFFKHIVDARAELLDRITIGDSRIIHILKRQKESLALAESTAYHTNAYPPDTSQWIALYPAQGASHHVRHEGMALAESVNDTEHVTEHYHWDDADALWDFATWG